MLTYYSTPIPGMGYSFSDLITQEALSLSGQIESDQTQQIADTVTNAEQQLGSPPFFSSTPIHRSNATRGVGLCMSPRVGLTWEREAFEEPTDWGDAGSLTG